MVSAIMNRAFVAGPGILVSSCLCLFLCGALSDSFALTMTGDQIASYQRDIAGRPLGERIALWAEKFIGTPYDPDPLGAYVTRKAVVADDVADCMYLTFRAAELALTENPEDAFAVALDKRFPTKGVVANGKVLNYADRFQYGEDMADSGKWGKDVTASIGPVTSITGGRGRDRVSALSKETLVSVLTAEQADSLFRSGDIVFFLKDPEKRTVGEIVGHIGILKVEGPRVFLIHAGGRKNKGGVVQKVSLADYVRTMGFAGIRVTRFQ